MKSKGLGDTIEKITKATGIKAVTDIVSKVTKKPCGCQKRKETINECYKIVLKISVKWTMK